MITHIHKWVTCLIVSLGVWMPIHAEGLTSDECWARAWKTASEISSAHDVGKTKARIFTRAAVVNREDLLQKWSDAETVAWVKASCDVARAYSAALYGTPERHQALLQDAVRTLKTADEWDQDRLSKPMLKAFVAGLWQKEQNLDALTRWIADDELNRMPAALHFFSDWLTRLQCRTQDDISQDRVTADILDLMMTHNRKFAPNERLQLLARVAPLLKNTKWKQPLLDEFEKIETNEDGLDFESLLNISRIEAGLGAVDRANATIACAEQMLQAGQTGDCLAPWAYLAEAKRSAGRGKEEIAATLQVGLTRAGDRPGYFKAIAEALTWASLAHEAN